MYYPRPKYHINKLIVLKLKTTLKVLRSYTLRSNLNLQNNFLIEFLTEKLWSLVEHNITR